VIVGGEDHRVGTDGEEEAFVRLEEYAATRFPGAVVVRRWSGQIMESIDGLPYIGRREEESRVFLGTGYAGNGLTFGTVAAQVLVDAVAGRANPYAPLYAPDRLLRAKQWAKYAAQNLPAAWTLVTDMLPLPGLASVEELEPGEGRVLRVGGEKVAASRAGDGTLHLVSSSCTHMGCEVAWNVVEQTWDCPCHGSRYDVDGAVLHGPATAPLEVLSATTGKLRT
jgi:Rieske Fe-S protein